MPAAKCGKPTVYCIKFLKEKIFFTVGRSLRPTHEAPTHEAPAHEAPAHPCSSAISSAFPITRDVGDYGAAGDLF